MDLYSAFIVVPHTQGVQVRITQFYLQITPYLPLPCKRSPDGASPDRGCGHLITVYYSFIYPKGWKAELAWLADLKQMVYRHKWSPVSCRSSAGQGKFAGQRSTFYQLCHATNWCVCRCCCWVRRRSCRTWGHRCPRSSGLVQTEILSNNSSSSSGTASNAGVSLCIKVCCFAFQLITWTETAALWQQGRTFYIIQLLWSLTSLSIYSMT